ncbi:MAG TPA: sulfite exporter TauE/SafE family protein [Chitinophagales bacterium]|nr:sulfite exporter TauE/SafE family protein [Chitinophagales bacterium]
MEFLLAALTIGFVGSLHCIGMCGPIALALPVYGQGVFNRIAGPLLYNTGRIITYCLLGILFGLLGKGFVIGGYQQLLSIVLGVLILFFMLLPASIKSRLGMTKIIAPFIAKIKSLLGRFLKQRTAGSFLIIGLLNGLLPCGLVYLAIAGAIATGDVINSGAFMMAFGIGTIPALLFVSIAAGSISLNVRSKITKAIPVFTIVMACLLILRGLDLGIPYLSPKLSKTDCTKHSCCAKK